MERACFSVQDQSGGLWVQRLHEEFQARMPLRNLQLKSRAGNNVFVDGLVLWDIPEEDSHFENTSLPMNWCARPLVSLYVFKCDDADLYRNMWKPKIKTWVDNQPDKQEWLIVLVRQSTDPDLAGKLRVAQKKVFDKLRSDFSSSRKERCLRMETPNGGEEQWDEFLGRLKECVLASFELRVAQHEAEINKLDEKREVPGWNFCQFFVVKESLAFLYEQMMITDDALKTYDELDALFEGTGVGISATKEAPSVEVHRHGSMMAGEVGKDMLEDGAKVLELNGKDYRKLIYENVVNEFDMRKYIFARQSRLLLLRHELVSLAQRARSFVSGMLKTLRLKQGDYKLSPTLISAWGFAASLSLATACEEASDPSAILSLSAGGANDTREKEGLSVEFDSAMVDLLETSRRSLSEVVRELWMPHYRRQEDEIRRLCSGESPTKVSLPKVAAASILLDNLCPGQRHPILVSSLSSYDEFTKNVIDMILRTTKYLQRLQRMKSLVRVNGELALIYLHMKRYQEAEALFKSQSSQYFADDWVDLFYPARELQAKCELLSGHLASYLQSCVVLSSPSSTLGDERRKHYFDEIRRISAKRQPSSKNASTDSSSNDGNLSSIPETLDARSVIKSQIHFPGLDSLSVQLGDETAMVFYVDNRLPSEVSFDSVSLQLKSASKDAQPVTFSVGTEKPVVLKPGKNEVNVSRRLMQHGDFICDKMAFHMNGIILIENVAKTPILVSSSAKMHPTRVLSVRHSQSSMKVSVLLPVSLFVGHSQMVRLQIATNNDNIRSGTINLVSPSDMVIENMEGEGRRAPASIVNDADGVLKDESSKEVAFKCENGRMTIPACDAQQVMEFELSIMATEEHAITHQLAIFTQYEKDTGELYQYNSKVDVKFSVPFSPSISFSMNDKTVFLQLALKCDSPVPLSIVDYRLHSTSNCSLVDDSNHIMRGMALNPDQKCSFLFELRRHDSVADYAVVMTPLKAAPKCELSVFYRADDEVSEVEDTASLPVSPSATDAADSGKTYQANFFVTLPIPHVYEIDLVGPMELVRGERAKFSLRVAYAVDEESAAAITQTVGYEIAYDPKKWVLSGKKRGSVKLDGPGYASVDVVFVPLTEGNVCLPEVEIKDVNQALTSRLHSAKTVFVHN